MSYQIDGSPIPLLSLRHTLRPDQSRVRVEGFPGLSDQIGVTAPQPGGLVIVRGFFNTTGGDINAAISALLAKIETEQQRMGDQSAHRVTLYNTTYPECVLVAFEVLGPLQRTPSPSSQGVVRLVRWTWRRLTTEVE